MGEPALKKAEYTGAEYLELEEQSEYKSEFYNGEIFAMSGGSRNHSVICVNLNRKLAESLDDKDCILFDSQMKLDIPKLNSFVYPDVMVVCGDIEFYENRTDIIRNPILIIEVLSPSTESFDRSGKFQYYQTVLSVKEYVLISQEKPMIEVYYKQDERNWLYSVANGLDEKILLRTIQCELALRDIYRKTDWYV
jgi:Uma2 family endonuclease